MAGDSLYKAASGHAVGILLATVVLVIAGQAEAQVTGQAAFTTPGTFTWTAPTGVTSVSVACAGAGGGAGSYDADTGAGGAGGGGGGGFVWANGITVTPGQGYTVTVGAGGTGPGRAGGNSWFISEATMVARGGGGGQKAGGAAGTFALGTGVTGAGFIGGIGGFQSWTEAARDIAGGGGGAGGYAGAGGQGGSTPVLPDPGTGGGGGGGRDKALGIGGGGGGTGVLGQGANGAAGTPTSVGGGGGSGGGTGTAAGSGGAGGGGAGGRIGAGNFNQTGGAGRCRIIWGPDRAYPSSNTGDLSSPPPAGGPPPSSGTTGQVVFDTAGTFTWTAPTGVTSVSAACIGGGGGAGSYGSSGNAAGGGGGALAWANNIPVTPGTNYTVTVGGGGSGATGNGGDSFFVSAATLVARGGRGAFINAQGDRAGGAGGTWEVGSTLTSSGGSNGGEGGWQSWTNTTGELAGGGGGAGGYTGAGGTGGTDPAYPPSAGVTGGGGGFYTPTTAGGGGGSGLLGSGGNGAAGTSASPGGGGGSGGNAGTAQGAGGRYGGGAGGRISDTPTTQTGAVGACRILWGGGRSYPSNAADAGSGTPPPGPPPSGGPAGQAVFDTPGSTSWVVPAGVTRVSAVCVGGGAGASAWTDANGGNAAGGGGGGLAWANDIPVTAGQSVSINVGAGGTTGNGGDSWFLSATTLVGRGGQGSFTASDGSQAGGAGGSFGVSGSLTSSGGGVGGSGGWQSWTDATRDLGGGGGGAGGYSGAGGSGGTDPAYPPTAGEGGAGGGGIYTTTVGGGGGGVSLVGTGTSGSAGTSSSPGGGGGSGGAAGANTGAGGRYGGGAGGRIGTGNQPGAGGACRVIWGGGRSYPSNAADVNSPAPTPSPSPPPPPVVTPSPPPPPPVIRVEHRILILTIPGFTNNDFLQRVFTGYSIPHDVRVFQPASPVDPSTYLYTADGVGRYSGIVIYPASDQNLVLGTARTAQLEAYQRATGARVVRFGTASDFFGVPTGACGSGPAGMVFAAGAPLGISGIKSTARLEADGLYRCAGALPVPASPQCFSFATNPPTIAPCTVTPVTLYESPNGLASAAVRYNDGREALIFTHDCAAWNPNCLLLAHLAVSWVTKNIIPGQRRALLSTQNDDLFLNTTVYNTPNIFRMTAADYTAHATWQTTINANLPPGSSFKIEHAPNGNGVLIQTGDTAALQSEALSFACQDSIQYAQLQCNCWATRIFETCESTVPYCKNCTRTWKRPDDPYGTSAISPTYSSSSWLPTTTWTSRDPLTAAVVSDLAGPGAFLYCSHTFTHQNLQNATNNDCLKQWQMNQDMFARLGITQAKGLAVRGVVTPAITGVRNGNNLRAMLTSGYRALVGDNTWPHLQNLLAPYTTLKTTTTEYGAAGVTIIPRWATEVYFNCNDTTSELALYNNLYRTFYGRDSTIEEVMDREAVRVVRDAFLSLRMDPHMFHQANLGTAGGVKSLLQRWVEAVLRRFTDWTIWPVETLGMDPLLEAFEDREQRDACSLVYTLTINTVSKAVTRIQVDSKAGSGTCHAPLLTTSTATLTGSSIAGPVTSVGARSYKVPLAANTGSVTLDASGLAW